MISEYEPLEALGLLINDDLDLALTYDYNLAPASPGAVLESVPLWSVPVTRASRPTAPTGQPISRRTRTVRGLSTPATPLTKMPSVLWRRSPASPRRIAHQIDSLDLVEDLIVAGYGVGLLPDRPAHR